MCDPDQRSETNWADVFDAMDSFEPPTYRTRLAAWRLKEESTASPGAEETSTGSVPGDSGEHQVLVRRSPDRTDTA